MSERSVWSVGSSTVLGVVETELALWCAEERRVWWGNGSVVEGEQEQEQKQEVSRRIRRSRSKPK